MSIDPRFAALLNRQAGGAPADTPAVDTSEQIYISSLALLKMLKHGRAGVPMEVGMHCFNFQTFGLHFFDFR
jgi:hypothetical protein